MNRAFDEQISREHFVVRVKSVNSDGIWGVHPYNNELISFFALQHIISIHQEVELNPDNPEHAALIKEYEEKTGKKIKSDLVQPKKPEASLNVLQEIPVDHEELKPGEATFVDIRNLELLAEQSKRSFEVQNNFGKL